MIKLVWMDKKIMDMDFGQDFLLNFPQYILMTTITL